MFARVCAQNFVIVQRCACVCVCVCQTLSTKNKKNRELFFGFVLLTAKGRRPVFDVAVIEIVIDKNVNVPDVNAPGRNQWSQLGAPHDSTHDAHA